MAPRRRCVTRMGQAQIRYWWRAPERNLPTWTKQKVVHKSTYSVSPKTKCRRIYGAAQVSLHGSVAEAGANREHGALQERSFNPKCPGR